MQWIARGCVGCLTLMVITGCAAPERRTSRPPPDPDLWRAPRVQEYRPPAAPPPPPQPAPRAPIAVQPAPRPAAPEPTGALPPDMRPPGGIRPGLWKVIVVHHSASPGSTPQGMDSWHRQRGWDGLGYHFVIGNGVKYPDGQIFVGSRWKGQRGGAHCKTRAGRYMGTYRPGGFFNDRGIGICLIGDFEKSAPTARQLAALRTLIAHLCDQAGIPASQVYGHGEITHATECPGDQLNMAAVRSQVAQVVASGQ